MRAILPLPPNSEILIKIDAGLHNPKRTDKRESWLAADTAAPESMEVEDAGADNDEQEFPRARKRPNWTSEHGLSRSHSCGFDVSSGTVCMMQLVTLKAAY